MHFIFFNIKWFYQPKEVSPLYYANTHTHSINDLQKSLYGD